MRFKVLYITVCCMNVFIARVNKNEGNIFHPFTKVSNGPGAASVRSVRSLSVAAPRETSRTDVAEAELGKAFASLLFSVSTTLESAAMASTTSKDSFTFTVGKLGTSCRALCDGIIHVEF